MRTVMGETILEGPSDAGSIPASSSEIRTNVSVRPFIFMDGYVEDEYGTKRFDCGRISVSQF